MKQISSGIKGVRTFFLEVQTELKKCAWPTRSELLDSTVVVIVSVAILGAYIGLSDAVIGALLRLMIH